MTYSGLVQWLTLFVFVIIGPCESEFVSLVDFIPPLYSKSGSHTRSDSRKTIKLDVNLMKKGNLINLYGIEIVKFCYAVVIN